MSIISTSIGVGQIPQNARERVVSVSNAIDALQQRVEAYRADYQRVESGRYQDTCQHVSGWSKGLLGKMGYVDRIQDPLYQENYLTWLLRDCLWVGQLCLQLPEPLVKKGNVFLGTIEREVAQFSGSTNYYLFMSNLFAKSAMLFFPDYEGASELIHQNAGNFTDVDPQLRVYRQSVRSPSVEYPFPDLSAASLSANQVEQLRHNMQEVELGAPWMISEGSISQNADDKAFIQKALNQVPKGRRALVLGGGEGIEARAYAFMRDRFTGVVTIDRSYMSHYFASQYQARLSAKVNMVPIEVIFGDLNDSLPQGSFSYVSCINVLGFLSKEQRASLLARLKAAIMPQGRAFLAVHLAKGAKYSRLLSGGSVGDKHFFKRDELKAELETAGFRVVQSKADDADNADGFRSERFIVSPK